MTVFLVELELGVVKNFTFEDGDGSDDVACTRTHEDDALGGAAEGWNVFDR